MPGTRAALLFAILLILQLATMYFSREKISYSRIARLKSTRHKASNNEQQFSIKRYYTCHIFKELLFYTKIC